MRVETLSDPAAFLNEARGFLLGDEARHNLILGLASTIRDRPETYESCLLWLVADGDDVVAAALQTPPYNLVLTGSEPAVAYLAKALAAARVEVPGVSGAVPEVDSFAARWEELTGRRPTPRMRQGIYSLSQVRPVAGVPGAARRPTEAERDLLVAWIRAFQYEAGSAITDAERIVELRLTGGDTSGLLVWDDDGPVSLAGWGGRTPNGTRIGPVYTPPEHRGRGYASAVTAAVSERQLASGRTFCFLYTDLENQTSNRIYMDIGYEPVCDAIDYAFEPR